MTIPSEVHAQWIRHAHPSTVAAKLPLCNFSRSDASALTTKTLTEATCPVCIELLAIDVEMELMHPIGRVLG